MRQVVQAQQPPFTHGLGQQTLTITQHLLARLLFGIQPIAGNAYQAAMLVAHVQRPDHTAQVRGKEPQNVVAEHVQGQLPKHLLSQLGLAVAQPGLVLQALGRTLLGLEVVVVTAGQRQQIAAPQVRQQGAEANDQQHERRNGGYGDGADLLVACHAQLLLGGNEVGEFLANLVCQALAAAVTDQLPVGAIIAAQGDHAAAEVIPGLLQGDQPVDTVNLLRVVLDHAFQALQAAENARLGHLIGVEEALVTRQQKAAHAGFHVDRQLHRFVGIANDPVGVFDPLHGRQQVVDHRDEGHGT